MGEARALRSGTGSVLYETNHVAFCWETVKLNKTSAGVAVCSAARCGLALKRWQATALRLLRGAALLLVTGLTDCCCCCKHRTAQRAKLEAEILYIEREIRLCKEAFGLKVFDIFLTDPATVRFLRG